ncbi:hypothetical protein [Clostridium sp.]|uniref:hypothetical protein n=1 Tax=Clostridium sp. TaxID=1506 RepID=UPI001B7861E1|nr:hypothetical protein [Clostridium sp.]MBP3915711.1 hypothetical protein [Clostridium sp.]
MIKNVDTRDLINIKIYVTKKINNASFWHNSSGELISQEEVNYINRMSIRNEMLKDYISIRYPQYSNSNEFKHELLKIIDRAIVKLYFVKYNLEVLKTNVSSDVLRQSFKGPRFYPYMNKIKYMIDTDNNTSTNNSNKATDKQIALLTKLVQKNKSLKFNFNLLDELTKEECGIIINYLTGKSTYIDSFVVKKYFKKIYVDSLFNFLDNQTAKDAFKEAIINFLYNYPGFFIDTDEIISQEQCNDLDRIGLAAEFLSSDLEIIKVFVNKNNRQNFMLDIAYYIDRNIPKIYYILYMSTYLDENIEFNSLDNFNTLKYSFTSKLDYKLSNYKGTDPENGLKASMKQIEYIYLLLQEKNMPLLLKDHRNLSKKDASEIIRKLKANNLLYDDKNKFFIEKK